MPGGGGSPGRLGGKCEIAGLLLLLCGRRGMCGTGPKNAGGIEEDGKGGRRIGGCGDNFGGIDLRVQFRMDPGRLRTCPFGGGRSVSCLEN